MSYDGSVRRRTTRRRDRRSACVGVVASALEGASGGRRVRPCWRGPGCEKGELLDKLRTGAPVTPVGVAERSVDDTAPVGWFAACEIVDDELVMLAQPVADEVGKLLLALRPPCQRGITAAVGVSGLLAGWGGRCPLFGGGVCGLFVVAAGDGGSERCFDAEVAEVELVMLVTDGDDERTVVFTAACHADIERLGGRAWGDDDRAGVDRASLGAAGGDALGELHVRFQIVPCDRDVCRASGVDSGQRTVTVSAADSPDVAVADPFPVIGDQDAGVLASLDHVADVDRVVFGVGADTDTEPAVDGQQRLAARRESRSCQRRSTRLSRRTCQQSTQRRRRRSSHR